jgi:hypothetical protein
MHMIWLETSVIVYNRATVCGHSGHGLMNHVVFLFSVRMYGIVFFIPGTGIYSGYFLFVSAIGTGSGHHESIQVIDTIVSAGIPSQMYAFLYLCMVVMHFGFGPSTKPFLDKLRGSHD